MLPHSLYERHTAGVGLRTRSLAVRVVGLRSRMVELLALAAIRSLHGNLNALGALPVGDTHQSVVGLLDRLKA